MTYFKVGENISAPLPTATRDLMPGAILYDGPAGLFVVVFGIRYFRNVISLLSDTTVFQVVGPEITTGFGSGSPSFPVGFPHLRGIASITAILNLSPGMVFKFRAQGTDPGWFTEENSFAMAVL